MLNLQKNNLDKASSPYLKQHEQNPIFWQEWSNEVLKASKEQNMLILASVGYTTCHWCHVMAQEAFSNKEIADFLNKHFISIKIDREQRPDLDNYFMQFIQLTQGNGGWPLNVFLTPDAKPFFAATYIPVAPKYNMPDFLSVLKHILSSYEKNKDKIELFTPLKIKENFIPEEQLLTAIKQNFDKDFGGFGMSMKFPPHNTLLFLLYYYSHLEEQPEENKNDNNHLDKIIIKEMITKTLDYISISGLHDHLQGGFYRYCTDRIWQIPHFEKMLYDQAMLLQVYSLAYKVFNKIEYKIMVKKIVQCIEETFEDKKNNSEPAHLFYSGHDADTNHEEGATYLWKFDELKQLLTEKESQQFIGVYEISEQGNFEGKNHLIKKQFKQLPDIEKKLLDIRKQKSQPFTDKKIITSWNALTGIAMMIAWRCTNDRTLKTKSEAVFSALLEKHYKNNILVHSSLGTIFQKEEFLEDYASMLLFATYIYEETGKYKEILEEFYAKINSLFDKEKNWVENKTQDFMEIPANVFDHPVPSSTSLAEMAVLRTKILLNENYADNKLAEKYKEPLHFDFYNIISLIEKGNFHIFHVPYRIEWSNLPINTIQVKNILMNQTKDNSDSAIIQDCYKQKCIVYQSVGDLKKVFDKGVSYY